MSTAATTNLATREPGLGLALRGWRLFCRALVRVFYRRVEVGGLDAMPRRGPLIVCANHASALADAALLQAVSPRPLRPLARSGLFDNPLLRPALAAQGAVPIFRAQDAGPSAGDPGRNQKSFARCFELLEEGEALLIFPEGQSHSDPRLRPFKTGAARLALGARERGQTPPLLLPVGLTFTEKGRFRSKVLVQLGAPLVPQDLPGEEPESAVRRVTAEVQAALAALTLEVDSVEDLELVERLQRFFALRRGRHELRSSLAHRFRALRRLIDAHRRLRLVAPERVRDLVQRLGRFERLCRRYGVKDYQLDVHYSPLVVLAFTARSLAFLLVVFPLALWGTLNSALPFLLTRHVSRRVSRGVDQYDSAKMLLGLGFFTLFWGAQSAAVWLWRGAPAALVYAVSIAATATVALAVRHERRRIWENTRAFVLFFFRRRRELHRYLLERREEIEGELARLARLARGAALQPRREPDS